MKKVAGRENESRRSTKEVLYLEEVKWLTGEKGVEEEEEKVWQ